VAHQRGLRDVDGAVHHLEAADRRTHRRSGNSDDLMAALAQLVDHADVGVPAGPTATE
jgi:hypothetical protein